MPPLSSELSSHNWLPVLYGPLFPRPWNNHHEPEASHDMIYAIMAAREVCLKHRKIRRENLLRVRVPHRTGSGVCFHIWMRPSFSSRIPGCQPGDAGAIPAGRTSYHINTAGASLRSGISKTPRVRGSTGTPCHFHRIAGRLRTRGASYAF